jgi:hypothetical protein
MSLDDVIVMLAHGVGAWRWSWAKVIGYAAALHGESATTGKMDRAFKK